MYSLRKRLVVAFCLVLVTASLAAAQVPTRNKLKFNINVSYQLKIGGYVLPAGQYVLYESSRDSNLFALHARNLASEPIAMIRTTRARYWTIPNDRSTKIVLDVSESSHHTTPVLVGWHVPYADGWEIVAVRAKNSRLLSRAR
jgi:hypothetical protein